MFEEQQYNELRQRLVIDPMQLDQELMRLAPDTQMVSEVCAQAILIRDSLNRELDTAKARAAKRLRENGEKKPSEATIASELSLDPEVIEAQAAHDEARFEASCWQALVGSYGEKGSSLRRICEMTLAGFMTPSAVYADRRAEMHAARQATPPTEREPTGPAFRKR